MDRIQCLDTQKEAIKLDNEYDNQLIFLSTKIFKDFRDTLLRRGYLDDGTCEN